VTAHEDDSESLSAWGKKYIGNLESVHTGSREEVLRVVDELNDRARSQRLTRGEQAMLKRAQSLLDAPDMWIEGDS
jgi:RNA polymerase-interacting CarD/CdnL/TRCF family regulator